MGRVQDRPHEQAIEVFPGRVHLMGSRLHWHMPAQSLVAVAERHHPPLTELLDGQNRVAGIRFDEDGRVRSGRVDKVLKIAERECFNWDSTRDVVIGGSPPGRRFRLACVGRIEQLGLGDAQVRREQR